MKEFLDEGEWIVMDGEKSGREGKMKLVEYGKEIMEK